MLLFLCGKMKKNNTLATSIFCLVLIIFTLITDNFIGDFSFKLSIYFVLAFILSRLILVKHVIYLVAFALIPIHIHTLLNAYGLIFSKYISYEIPWPYPSLFNQKNFYGLCINLSIIALFFFVKKAFADRKPWGLTLLTTSIAFNLIMLYLVDSRMNQLLFFISGVLLLWPHSKLKTKLMVLLPFFSFLIPVIFVLLGKLELFPKRLHSFQERIYFWVETLKEVLIQPLNGYGFHHMRHFSRDIFLRDEYSTWMNPKMAVAYCHNFFIQLAYEIGLLKFVLLVVCFMFLMINLYRRVNTEKSNERDFVLISIGVIFIIAQLTVAFNFLPVAIVVLGFFTFKYLNLLEIKSRKSVNYILTSLILLLGALAIIGIFIQIQKGEDIKTVKKAIAAKEVEAVKDLSGLALKYGQKDFLIYEAYLNLLIENSLYAEVNEELEGAQLNKDIPRLNWFMLSLKVNWMQKRYDEIISLSEAWFPKFGNLVGPYKVYLSSLAAIGDCQKFNSNKKEFLVETEKAFPMWYFINAAEFIKSSHTLRATSTETLLNRNFNAIRARDITEVNLIKEIKQMKCPEGLSI